MDGLHSQPRAAADEFRLALQQGTRPRIEDFLSEEHAQPEVIFLQLLTLDTEHRRQRGELPEPEDYLPRFPQYHREIVGFFTSTESNSMMAASTVVQCESQANHGTDDDISQMDLSVDPLLDISHVSSENQKSAHRVDQLCDAFEQEWRAGRRPEIDSYLQKALPADQPSLFRELVALDWEFRQKLHEHPTLQDYISRYPAFAALLKGEDPLGQSPPKSSRRAGDSSSGQSPPRRQGDTISSPLTTISGRYRLEKLVGRGGFAEVWQAIDTLLNRTVAVKRPRADLPEKHAAFASFLQEARRVAGLEFPGVVPVYDVCDEAGRCWIVSQYIDGEPLDARMKRGPVPVEEAVEIVAQVAETLNRAHLQDIVHRDVKPGNILLNKAGKPFVADFGLAVSEAEQLDERKALLGTCLYMSPEQARGDCHRVDGRSDIYSLGVVLYHLLTGSLPFLAKTQSEYIDQILNRDIRPLRARVESIPAELERICLKCLEKQPGQRYRTALDLATELRAWQKTLQTKAVAEVPPPHGNRMLIARGGFTVILLVIAFVIVTTQKPNGSPAPSSPTTATATVPPVPASSVMETWKNSVGQLPREIIHSSLNGLR